MRKYLTFAKLSAVWCFLVAVYNIYKQSYILALIMGLCVVFWANEINKEEMK